MTVHRLVALLRRRLLLIVAGVLVGLLAAIGYTARATPTYSAEAKLYVSTTTQDKTGSELVNAGLYAGSQVKSFAQVVTTGAVLDDVIDSLNLDTTAGDLARQMTVSVPLDTVVLDIQVRDSDPQRAADIANAVADRVPTIVEGLTRPRPADQAPTKVNLLEGASTPTVPVSPNKKLDLLAGLIVGGVLGLVAAALVDALRRRVTSVVEVEVATGAPVLGVLPDHRSEDPDALQLAWTSVVAAGGHAPRTILLAALADHAAPRLAGRLAGAVAETGRPVVWVDADLRGSRATGALEVPRSPGLAEVLQGDASVEETLRPWHDSTLRVLPSGAQREETTRFFAGAAMGRAIDDLRVGAETTVIDGMATTTVAELAVLAQYADATVLVVTPRLSRRALAQSSRELRAAGVRLAGVLVDDVRQRDRADFERRLVGDLELAEY